MPIISISIDILRQFSQASVLLHPRTGGFDDFLPSRCPFGEFPNRKRSQSVDAPFPWYKQKLSQNVVLRQLSFENPRFSRAHPIITCTQWQVGRRSRILIASNVHRSSKRRREACNHKEKSCVPNKRCGSKRARHAPSRENTYYIRRITPRPLRKGYPS